MCNHHLPCTAGATLRFHALRRTWPTALTLFGTRLVALWLGGVTGEALASNGSFCNGHGSGGYGGRNHRDVEPLRNTPGCCGWTAYVTQVTVTP